MFKKLLGLIVSVIVIVFAIGHLSIDLNRGVLSDLSLANVEALAGGEDALPYENMVGENRHCALHLGGGWYTASVEWYCYCPHNGVYSSCYPKPCGY